MISLKKYTGAPKMITDDSKMWGASLMICTKNTKEEVEEIKLVLLLDGCTLMSARVRAFVIFT